MRLKSKSPSKAGAKAKPVVLLSGGNPQIAKADGDAPVQVYIATMPGWKRDIGKRLDALIVRNVPNVRKAVKWNSPMYGIEGQGLFLGFHSFTHYVKVTFFAARRCDRSRPSPASTRRCATSTSTRGRARRGADGDLGEASGRVARLDSWPIVLRICLRIGAQAAEPLPRHQTRAGATSGSAY